LSNVDPATLASHFDSQQAESRWDRAWAEQGVHRFDEDGRGPRFVIDTPPPTVSGSLHVGHVFSFTQTDVLARHRRMQGRNVFYPMGWDDNGLPTERRVQNYYHVRCDATVAYEPGLKLPVPDDATRKQPPRKLSRKNFIELCLILTAEDEQAFKALWRRLGLSVDWSLEYSTISDASRAVAQLSFLDLFAKGHVYSVEAPTMWDIDFKTAVAQAEVEDRPQRGAFHHIRFAASSGGSFVIATTRPELLPACVGVAAHPDDARYAQLIGQEAITPLFGVPVPVFASQAVDPQKGTGILMVCTFGDATDVAWWRERALPLRQVLGLDGRFQAVSFGSDAFPSLAPEAANAAYAQLAGKSVKEGQRVIVELLRAPAADGHGSPGQTDGAPPLVQEPQPVEHAVKFFEKGDRPLEFVTTRQWFVRLMDQKAELVARGDEIAWHPDFMRLRFKNWTENLQLDWCISRQRFFGVPFPVWYPLDAAGQSDYEHPILADAAVLPVDPSSDTPPGFSESDRGRPGGFRAESDVFDTWFTSSMTPQITTGWHARPERYARLFPMDLRPQSHEIIRTWAFYTIAKALLHEASIPWRHVAISGWVLDPDRKKMSKSKGNVLTPMHLLDEYGADAVRYWALSARLGSDTTFDEKVLKVGRRLVTKLFNASKFVLQQTGAEGEVCRDLDVSFLYRLQQVVDRASEALNTFEHAVALDAVERFFWSGFTDTYLEMVKARARSESDPEGRGSALAALRRALRVFLRLFAPFLPYVTEEIWSWGLGEGSIHRSAWPGAADFPGLAPMQGGEAVFETALGLLDAIHKAKGGAGATVGRHLKRFGVAANGPTLALAARAIDDVMAAGRVLEHRLETKAQLPDGAFEVLECELADGRPEA
jgi:valyl-tRNA synthetase